MRCHIYLKPFNSYVNSSFSLILRSSCENPNILVQQEKTLHVFSRNQNVQMMMTRVIIIKSITTNNWINSLNKSMHKTNELSHNSAVNFTFPFPHSFFIASSFIKGFIFHLAFIDEQNLWHLDYQE